MLKTALFDFLPKDVGGNSRKILIHENLGLDTKITFLLQLEQKLWYIYLNKVWNCRPSWIV